MELERRNFRAMIYYDFKRGLTQEQCLKQLFETFEDAALSRARATVFRWFAEFKRGREILEDEPHTGRPPTSVLPETITAVERMLKVDGRLTHCAIQEGLNIGETALNTILHEHLLVRKVSAHWVPHSLTEEERQHRANWCQYVLKNFDHGMSKEVYNIVTGDESWIYQFDPETKRQSSVWIFPHEHPP